MAYAVLLIGGKQYRVSPQDTLTVDKLDFKAGTTAVFDQVYLLVDGDKVSLGTPLVKDSAVSAQILEHIKGPKIRVATYTAKSRHRKVKGHRQPLTRVKILSIVNREKKSVTKPKTHKVTKVVKITKPTIGSKTKKIKN